MKMWVKSSTFLTRRSYYRVIYGSRNKFLIYVTLAALHWISIMLRHAWLIERLIDDWLICFVCCICHRRIRKDLSQRSITSNGRSKATMCTHSLERRGLHKNIDSNYRNLQPSKTFYGLIWSDPDRNFSTFRSVCRRRERCVDCENLLSARICYKRKCYLLTTIGPAFSWMTWLWFVIKSHLRRCTISSAYTAYTGEN